VPRYVPPPYPLDLAVGYSPDVEDRRPDPMLAASAASLSSPSDVEAPALRDAAEIVRRATDDEAAASEARARYRTAAPGRLELDARTAAILDGDEWLIAERPSAILDRRAPRPGEYVGAGLAGQLLVTSRRLIFAGRQVVKIDLVKVEEIVLSGERLLVVMRDGVGFTLDVEQPRLLRVQISAARAGARVARASSI
jgi:hypothetical protein